MAISERDRTRKLRRLQKAARLYSDRPSPFRQLANWISRRMPKRLYARSLIIIITPMVLLQSVVAFVFMERHWQTVTQRLSTAVSRDIAAIISVAETYPQDVEFKRLTSIAADNLDLNIAFLPLEPLPPPGVRPFFSILDNILISELSRQIKRPFWIDTVGNSDLVEIRVQMERNVLRVFAKRSQAYASNTHIFLLWMVGTSLVLLGISILFLRNQIRPIQKLSEAAESFGKGRPMPRDFRPRGAEEIRRAGLAFIQMRERIERQIEQRTAMLTGVSHDLRTILTRFKLQLALLPKKIDASALEADVSDMQTMLEGYMSFARGEGQEETGVLELEILFDKLVEEAKLRGRELDYTLTGKGEVYVRPNAFTRLIQNIVSNAFRYAESVSVTATHQKGWLTIIVDDDGPGIAPEHREDVFRPFVRLDEARNQDESGTGLGLSIARDIARSHGGSVLLSDSPLGGLRATIRIPA
jgi:two-component system, OmpR family, osmolarity sensor histidine kinase EnvZ